ncbi:MAG TPA: hypothetical protein VNK41_04145 [Vicinamibacterales bacterium]|nr:hypothetical protein [Vicinamibacterales bacterium]
MTPAEWLAFAGADAERRGLPEMIPVLRSLADAIARLRADDPDRGETPGRAGSDPSATREAR